MASFKSHPVFSSLLIVIGVVVAGEAWLCYNRFEVAKKSAAGLRAKRTELASLEAVRPFPSEESKAAVEADLRRTQVALDTMIPISFGVLTTENLEQAIERAGTKAGNKGFDAAMTAIEMVNLYRQI